MSAAESEKIILVEICLETEFNIHEITMLLFFIHELRRSGSLSASFKIDPSMNPSLFFTESAMVIVRLHTCPLLMVVKQV